MHCEAESCQVGFVDPVAGPRSGTLCVRASMRECFCESAPLQKSCLLLKESFITVETKKKKETLSPVVKCLSFIFMSLGIIRDERPHSCKIIKGIDFVFWNQNNKLSREERKKKCLSESQTERENV